MELRTRIHPSAVWGAGALALVLVACGGGGGGSTPPVTVTIPAAPTGVAAVPGNHLCTVGWTASSGATSYNVYWGTASGVTTTSGTKVAGAASPYAHAGLVNGTPYYYVVTAVNSAGESPASAQANATPFITAPTGVTATPGTGQVAVAWTPVTGATSDAIYWSHTTGVTKANGTKIAAAANPYTHTGLTNGLDYYYVVTASDAAGESAESAQAHAVPLAAAAPAAPTGLAAQAGNTQVNLTWTAPSGATGYNVYRSTSSGALAAKTKLTSTALANAAYVDTSVVNGTLYYYQVTAVNAGGESAGSTEAMAPVINLSGTTWALTLTVATNTCGTDIGNVVQTAATITQAAGTYNFTGTMSTGGTFTGSINGTSLTLTGSAPYTSSGYAGTLAFTTTATWARSGSSLSFSGTSTYAFSYAGAVRCTGTLTNTGVLQ